MVKGSMDRRAMGTTTEAGWAEVTATAVKAVVGGSALLVLTAPV